MEKQAKKNLVGYAFVIPAFILLFTFVVLPVGYAIYLSLTKFNGFSTPAWIGMKNYAEAFQDKAIRASIRNTIVYVLIAMPIQISLALVIAALLASRFRSRFGEFVRGSMFIPTLCSATLIGAVFSYVFSADAGGLMNMLIQAIGFQKVNWLGGANTALGVIITVNVWKNVGYYVVILYAGIMDIPVSLYEVSAIDGATRLKQFFYITIPNLKNVLFMVITVCTIWSFQIFDMPYMMTSGGPGYATTTLTYQLYLQAFKSLNFGYANAIGMILFGVVLIINLIQRVLMREDG